MHIIHWLSIFCLTFYLLSPARATEQVSPVARDTFRLSMFIGPDNRQTKMMTLLYQDLFQRLGVKVDIRELSMTRASVQANTGKIDGEAIRISAYSEIHTNMRRVNFPVAQVVFVTYARKQDQIKLNDGWEDLIHSGYRIGYLRGIMFSERYLYERIDPLLLSYAKSIRQGFLKLVYGRIDLFIHSRGNFLQDEEMNELLVEASVVEVVPLYMHVHESHTSLIPIIEQGLNEMKKEGRLLEICQQIYLQQAENHCFAENNPYSQLQW
ncbi:substrate-binding periplasmic protein [Vibrio quintilis]|uniref:Bacterial extracellular solute-binding proteins, family 3 n=1 Tax=Vibrio quintilis TaxID=1117707 RepID=A0A1M7YSW7_9VIBR|nr:transporter substrate-binding domain-containing protein [Vibrio quintilis]SHO55714.1 Bacterial extracellular solute-binding proteins, family 3 [Vibrio quintilis]